RHSDHIFYLSVDRIAPYSPLRFVASCDVLQPNRLMLFQSLSATTCFQKNAEAFRPALQRHSVEPHVQTLRQGSFATGPAIKKLIRFFLLTWPPGVSGAELTE